MRDGLKQLLGIAGALADESRVRCLVALNNGEVCVCQLIELLGLAPSTVSKHLSILKNAGLVESRKEGRWMHYRLALDGPPMVREALAMVARSLDGDARASSDLRRMRQILREDPQEICRRQSGRDCCQPPLEQATSIDARPSPRNAKRETQR